jgi:hypothetical protein
VNRSAVIDGKYRYLLTRGPGVDACGFVMLNPSTADGLEDDPTIRRLMGFTSDWGYRSFHVANLYAYRTPYPAALWYPGAGDIVGPDNDGYLHAVATLPLVVVAWGKHAGVARVAHALEILRAPGRPLFCLGTNGDGSPKHPLYIPYAEKLIEYGQFT